MVSDMTDVPFTEFKRNNSFAPALCGAKLLAPTIERLLPGRARGQ
jgi:hypothetical protein